MTIISVLSATFWPAVFYLLKAKRISKATETQTHKNAKLKIFQYMVGWIAYRTQHSLAVTAQINARCRNIHTELAGSLLSAEWVYPDMEDGLTGWQVLCICEKLCFASSPVSMSWFAFESGCQLGHSDSAGLQNIEAVVH